MGKIFVFCRIKLKFYFWLYKKRLHTSWKFQLEITSNKKVIAKKPLTNFLEMNSTLEFLFLYWAHTCALCSPFKCIRIASLLDSLNIQVLVNFHVALLLSRLTLKQIYTYANRLDPGKLLSNWPACLKQNIAKNKLLKTDFRGFYFVFQAAIGCDWCRDFRGFQNHSKLVKTCSRSNGIISALFSRDLMHINTKGL